MAGAGNVLAGVREARERGEARCTIAEPVLLEIEGARTGMRRAKPGDMVVVCADDSAAVYREAMAFDRGPRPSRAIGAPGEFAVPEG